MAEHEHHNAFTQARMEELMQQAEDPAVSGDVAALLGLFGDPTRVRILFVLLRAELCVGDFAQKREMTTSAISHQLRILKQGRLVKSRREGRTVYYSLADSHVHTILYHALEHVME